MTEVPQVQLVTAITGRVTGVVYRRKRQRAAPSVDSSGHTVRALQADSHR